MKFNEIVKQFQHNVFGNLTTIRSVKDKNKIWFLGKEIQELLGHSNLTQAIKNANLNPDESIVFKKSANPEFFNELTKQCLVGYGKRSSSITYISESGLYKLILRSNKTEAVKFTDWVTSDVLPKLRQNVEEGLILKMATVEIGKHIDDLHQKEESKKINGKNMKEGGRNKTINYNIRNCVDHDKHNRTPTQIKTWAKNNGVPSAQRTSAKQVLRTFDKPAACSMSLHDNLVTSGVDYDKALKVTNGVAKELYRELLSIGVSPKELRQ